MVPGSAPGGNSREADLTTSSAEQRTRTHDVVPAGRPAIAGPATGDVLKNRFVLHQCLADGATSRLFRALDRRREAAGDPDPWVVLKIVTAPPATGLGEGEPRALQALRREAAIARGLDHPNLPRIIGIDHDGPHTFVCMAWIEGESLAAILDSRGARPMTRVQALQIIEGAGRALMHLHARGISHADVKPGNILVTARGDATLLDFGVAVGPGAGDLPGLRGYTPEYASPEVLAGNDPAPSDDLFSLACVAYRMLGGHRAFGAANAREAAAAGTRPVMPQHLSPAQWRALDRALGFTRAGRQPDIGTFLAQLKGTRDEALAITELPAPEPGVPATAPPPGRAFPGVGAVARPVAALLLVAIAGLAGTVWLQRSPEATPAAPAEPAAPAATNPPENPVPVASPAPLAADVPAPPRDPAAPPAVPPPGEPPAARRPAEPPGRAPGPRVAALAAAPEAPTPPVELAGPPVPESFAADPAGEPAVPEVTAPGGAAADTAAAASVAAAGQAVPFSRLTVRHYVAPDYPRNAATRRVPGWVDVAFEVDPSGRTQNVRVLAAEPPDLFDAAALAAVRRWRLAGPDGVSTPVSSQIRVRFQPD